MLRMDSDFLSFSVATPSHAMATASGPVIQMTQLRPRFRKLNSLLKSISAVVCVHNIIVNAALSE